MKEKTWHELFEASVIIKGLNGTSEIVGGLFFFYISPFALNKWLSFFPHKEILANTQTFAALYLLVHGVVNLYLAFELYRDRHWSYLVAIGVTMLSIFYQIHRVAIYHSRILTAITAYDFFFIYIAWHEYKHHQDNKAKRQPPADRGV